MVFTQIWYLHKQALQDQNKGFTNYAEFTSNDEITQFHGTTRPDWICRRVVPMDRPW